LWLFKVSVVSVSDRIFQVNAANAVNAGHLAVQYSRKMGYKTVAISSSADKKDFATKLGAHHYIDTSSQDVAEELQKMGGASLIVATAPNPKAIAGLVGGCGPLGKLLILAGTYRHTESMPYNTEMNTFVPFD
jgi:D-arabinose 1-dehydrogenase-like Zn-dependent alcohol dehydrogenase